MKPLRDNIARLHALAPEPFLLVGLISAIRRVLLLTAQLGEPHEGAAAIPPGPMASDEAETGRK